MCFSARKHWSQPISQICDPAFILPTFVLEEEPQFTGTCSVYTENKAWTLGLTLEVATGCCAFQEL